jgi:predicted site-specific integrase-resolvase
MSDYDFKRAAYTPKETMEILSIGRTSLYSAGKSGKLKITKLGGKKSLFLASDIAAFVETLRDAGSTMPALPTKSDRSPWLA